MTINLGVGRRGREEEEEKETGGKSRILRTEFWRQVEEKTVVRIVETYSKK